MNLMKAADVFIEKVRRDYVDDVAVVVIMGSFIYEDTHDRSDLDMFFVPKTKRGYNLGMTCIIDGIGFDFWPISWERLERIANHEERITSIVTEGKVVYYGTDEDLAKFNEVKAKAMDVSDMRQFIQKAKEQLNHSYRHYFALLHSDNLSDARRHTMSLVSSLTYAIALLNRTTVKRGRGKLKQEILDMQFVPHDFSELYDTVFVSSDIGVLQKNYGQLLLNTEALLSSVANQDGETIDFADALDGFYEELVNFYNKIYHACEVGDVYTTMFVATEITHEIEQAFEGTGVSAKQLPNLVGALELSDLESFVPLVEEHQKKLVELLHKQGITILEFEDFIELENYMKLL